MDLIVSIIILLAIIFWPRMGEYRYYLLFFVGLGMLVIALVLAPILLLTPLFYLAMIVFFVLSIYRIVKRKQGE